MTEREYRLFAQYALQNMDDLNSQLEVVFGIGHYDRWDYQQESGDFVFSHQAVPKVAARVQLVGSYSSAAKTWLWSWANPTIVESAREQVSKVREFGIAEGIPRLAEAKWSGEESDCWEMTAVSAKLLEAKGAYRCPVRSGFLYAIFMDVKRVAA